jgi:hypothetical protein
MSAQSAGSPLPIAPLRHQCPVLASQHLPTHFRPPTARLSSHPTTILALRADTLQAIAVSPFAQPNAESLQPNAESLPSPVQPNAESLRSLPGPRAESLCMPVQPDAELPRSIPGPQAESLVQPTAESPSLVQPNAESPSPVQPNAESLTLVQPNAELLCPVQPNAEPLCSPVPSSYSCCQSRCRACFLLQFRQSVGAGSHLLPAHCSAMFCLPPWPSHAQTSRRRSCHN